MSALVYHVVTERPMEVGQRLIFDENHPNGVNRRVDAWLKYISGESIADEALAALIASNPDRWAQVARRELAMERVRAKQFPDFPSRLRCLYTSRTLEDARSWAGFFNRIGRQVYGIAVLEVHGRLFDGDACNCFDGGDDEAANLEKALHYWKNDIQNPKPVIETLADGEIIVREFLD